MRLLKIALFLCLNTVLVSVHAQTLLPENMSLDQLADQADLVFQGTVRKIEYKASVDKIPHTFVTYDVEDVIQGSYNKPQITLRFVGGFMEKNGETIQLSVSHAPKIDQGEQGVMMVKGNASVQCPLVACSFGRFKYTEGHVSDAGGRLMAMDADGNVQRVRNFMRLQAQALEDGNDLSTQATSQESVDNRNVPMDAHTFVSHLRSLAGKKGLSKRARANRVRSADPSKPFKGPEIKVGSPPSGSDDVQASVASQGSDYDRWEMEQLRKSGGNPVLQNSYPGNIGGSVKDGARK